MTEYTAEDFARARVAIQGERESARRTYPGDDLPWLSRNGGRWSDHELAELDWTPVQESQPLTANDAIKALVIKRERVLVAKIREAYRFGGSPSALRIADAVYQGLTEKPRPKGAVELADAMEDYSRDGLLKENGLDGLADHLAAMGYRKEQS